MVSKVEIIVLHSPLSKQIKPSHLKDFVCVTSNNLRPIRIFFKLNKMISYKPLDARLVFSQLNNIQLVIEGGLMMTSHNI